MKSDCFLKIKVGDELLTINNNHYWALNEPDKYYHRVGVRNMYNREDGYFSLETLGHIVKIIKKSK